MARIRTVKPEFFTSLTIADLPLSARLTFIGLWTHVDDEGRCVDDARLIKAAVWPLDDITAADVEDDLKRLTESSLITRYTLNRRRYLAVTNWAEHQKINRPTPSKLPSPDEGDPAPAPEPPTSGNGDSLNTHGVVSEDSPPERKGTGNREGKGTPLPPTHDRSGPPAAPAPETGLTRQMLDAWWAKYGKRTAQGKRSIRTAIADALTNGLDPHELWAALERLGEVSKPVTGGTLQFALADVRKPSNVVALPVGQRDGTDARVAGWGALAAQLDSQGDPS